MWLMQAVTHSTSRGFLALAQGALEVLEYLRIIINARHYVFLTLTGWDSVTLDGSEVGQCHIGWL